MPLLPGEYERFGKKDIDDALPYPKKMLLNMILQVAITDKTGTPSLLKMHDPF